MQLYLSSLSVSTLWRRGPASVQLSTLLPPHSVQVSTLWREALLLMQCHLIPFRPFQDKEKCPLQIKDATLPINHTFPHPSINIEPV